MRLPIRWVAAASIFAAAAFAAETPADIRDAIQRLNEKVANTPAALEIEFRVKAAQALHAGWPDLSRELTSRSVAQLRSGTGWRITFEVVRVLASLDPDGAISVLPRIRPFYAAAVIDALGKLHRIDDARKVYRAALAREVSFFTFTAASGLLNQLHNEKSAATGDVYRDVLSGFSFDALEPEDAFWIDRTTELVQEIAPAAAVEGTLRILSAASNPAYNKAVSADATGDFQVGSRKVIATNSRDTVLLMAGARLFALAPAEFEKHKALFERWSPDGPIVVEALRGASNQGKARTIFSAVALPPLGSPAIDRIGELEDEDGIDNDLVVRLAAQLRRVPRDPRKLSAALSLCEIALVRQASQPALSAAASALLAAIRDTHPILKLGRSGTAFSEHYLRLAELIRYAHARLPVTDPAVEAAEALLELRERVLEHIGFSLEDMDGQPHTITPVPGRVTVVSLLSNVCARWKAQCDRPLPALEKFYREFGPQGVAVFGVAEEGRELFADSLDGETFTVPIFFDPDDAFESTFGVPGRHEYFLFDSRGKLVARTMGIRTQDELREIAKSAGLR